MSNNTAENPCVPFLSALQLLELLASFHKAAACLLASTKSYLREKYNRKWQWSCQQKCKDDEYVGMEEGEVIRVSECSA